MNFEHEGISLWYGTPDAPAPNGAVQADAEITVTVGVQPIDGSNQVELLYRTNQGPTKRITCKWLRNDFSRKVQYFKVRLPAFQINDTVEYTVICRIAGRQAPSPEAVKKIASSFHVVGAQAEPKPGFTANEMLSTGTEPVQVDPQPGSESSLQLEPFIVKGQIRQEDGTPLVGSIVRAYEKRLRGESCLGQAITDPQGSYEIRYNATQLLQTDKKSKNLLVRAFNQNEELLVASTLLCDAPAIATVDLMVGGQVYRGPSEYERFMTELSPVLQSIQLIDLKDDDAAFLMCATGIDQQYIMFLIVAAKLSRQADLPPEVFYGFARQGLTLVLPSIFAQGSDSQRRALQQALNANIIPIKLSTHIDAILKQLQQLTVGQAFKTPDQPGTTSLSTLLSTTVPEKTIQEQFLTTFLQHKGPIENFWQSLAQQPAFQGNDRVKNLQLTIQLGAVTRNHVPLVQELLQSGAVHSVQDLAKLGESDWRALLDKQKGGQAIGFPADVPGNSDAEKAANYAKTLSRTVEEILPSAVVANRIATANLPGKADLVTFLANSPDFNFASTHIDSYLADKGSTALQGVSDVKALAEHLRSNQRIYHVTQHYDEMQILLTNGIESALAISEMGHSSFLSQYGSQLGQDRAEAIYARADHLSAKALTVFGKYSAATNSAALPLILDPATAISLSGSVNEGLRTGDPNLTTLFGTQDFCSCDDCRSMESPAAYLIDILSFLSPTAQSNLLDTARRRDLGEIELSCANTNTPMPYIDLVNEVLERAVVQNNGGALPASGFWPQTTWTAEELSANPEYLNDDAYSILARTIYPWDLPFDLGTEEARVYLGQLGVKRDELMKTFQKRPVGAAPEPSDNAIAGEYLHISPLEQFIITSVPVAKAPVRAATTGTIMLSGLQTIDGVALAADDRVLVKDQAISAENGIYLAKIGKWERAADDDTGSWVSVTVTEGAQNKGDKQQFLPQPLQFWLRDIKNPQHLVVDHVPVFLQQSGLTYQELVELLETTYINPTDPPQAHMAIEFQPDQNGNATCDLQSANIKNLTLPAAERIHRFVLLRRKLGWTTRDLDRTISAVQPGDLTPDFLLQLAHIKQLSSSLSVPLIELLSWWAPIDTSAADDGTPSFYERLFQNKTVARIEPDDVFNLHASSNPQLKDHIPGIIAALGVSASDLALLIDGTVANQVLNLPAAEVSDPALNLTNLSHLYRIVSMARAIKLSISDFLSLKALSGINPFDPNHMEETQHFVDNALRIHSSSFSIAELDYLLRNVYQQGSSIVPTDDSIVILLQQIQTGLQKIFADTTSAPDPTGNLTRQKLAILLPPDQLEKAMAVIAGTIDDANFISTAFKDFLDANDAQQKLGHGPGTLPTLEARYQYVLDPLMAYLRTTASERFVQQQFREILKLDVATSNALLQQIITSPRTPLDPNRVALAEFLDKDFVAGTNPLKLQLSTLLDIQLTTFKKVLKAGLVVKKFKITADELTLKLPSNTHPWFVERAPTLGWLDLNALPVVATNGGQPLFDGWRRLLDFFTFRHRLLPGKPTLFEILEGAITFTAVTDATTIQAAVNAYIEQLSPRVGRPQDDLQALIGVIGVLGLNFPNDYKDEHVLVRLSACFTIMRELGVAPQQLILWVRATVSLTESRNITKAVKAKYDNDQWLAVTKPLRDTLREKQRDALVAYMIGQNQNPTFSDANTLFNYFLIDVEMSSCQLTSRIKQAIGSVQLFIQQTLMNLEPGVTISADDAKHWTTWMKNYRVWQANREVFLYPENWIEPELRDNKTPFFKDFENEILQGEITNDRAEEAFMHYLEKLDAVARLEIVGMYHQKEVDASIDILHVFGRTWNTPHIYYYRRLENSRRWTPWEKVDTDIQGDHLIPVIWNRRLHLFWPIFTQKQQSGETDKHMEIQIAWSEYKQGKWSTKKMSPVNEPLTSTTTDMALSTLDAPLDASKYVFKAAIEQNQPGAEVLAIRCVQSGTARDLSKLDALGIIAVAINPELAKNLPIIRGILTGEFQFTDCGGSTKVHQYSFNKGTLLVPERSKIDFMTWEESGLDTDEPDSLNMLLADTSSTEVLGLTPGTFHVLYPHQYDPFVSQDSWFYEDDTRTFFVELAEGGISSLAFFNPGKVYPGLIDVFRAYPYERVSSIQGSFNPAVVVATVSDGGTSSEARPYYRLFPMPIAFIICSFKTFYHPYVCDFIRRLNRGGIDELLLWSPPDGANPTGPVQLDANLTFFKPTYDPMLDSVSDPFPQELVDFTYGTPYADYNWELFFHAPLLVATRLSNNQRFDEALKWFHYIFDPTNGFDDPTASPEVQQRIRYWKVRAFRDEAKKMPTTLQQLLVQLGADGELNRIVNDWKDHPFNPHLIARERLVSYQRTVVMKYIDTLIAWGDQLFRRDTIEAINEATLLYILAAETLGPTPQQIPPAVTTSDHMTYNQLVQMGLNMTSNQLIAIENLLLSEQDISQLAPGSVTRVVIGSGKTLFFCIPGNSMLLGYWNTVADRLFKIRHCMNIEGVVRQLPLFEPPIDPGLLVRAAAAGVDLSTALNDVNAALPHYRFTTMLQKALDLCADVRALGAALLAALEKHDAEELALLRASQEIQVLTAVRLVKQNQLDEATATWNGLNNYKEVVKARQLYYQTLLKQGLLSSEQAHLNNLKFAWQLQANQAATEIVAGIVHLIPDVKLGFPTTVGATYGGSNIGAGIQAFGNSFGIIASILSTQGSISATQAGNDRRTAEWTHQQELATKEMLQVDNQITAADFRMQIAQHELDNHDLQTQNASDIEDYLKNQKFTNIDLYDWMIEQLSTVYFQSYQFAYDIAKRVERTYSYELAEPDATFIHFGYWDNLKKGLLAGEQLQQDLRRMEMAYLEQNRREYEITRHIPLSQLDPIALLMLKKNGECFVSIPEVLFDADYPGHYLRRIKTVSLSIPCIVGPYTSVNCTLTLLWNSLRQKLDGSEYLRKDTPTTPDHRFRDNVGAIQSIVTSSGQTDNGMFELNFHDERYLPFEGAGAISDWHIELPHETNAFDFDTITDVIIHLRYTARSGGDTLKNNARKALGLSELPTPAVRKEPPPSAPLRQIFSSKHDFSSDWYRFLHPKDIATSQELSLDITTGRFPFQFRDSNLNVHAMMLFLELKDGFTYDGTDPAMQLAFTLKKEDDTTTTPTFKSFPASFKTGVGPIPTLPFAEPLQGQGVSVDKSGSKWSIEVLAVDAAKIDPSLQRTVTVNSTDYIHLNPDAIEDLWIVCEYSVE